ncbi:hypothetical protein NPIL_266501 [Nephila pilipes]|uniref:Uncharacterized protein n=1 Tax=Nephila pilipes TaxID=299642 RepID=A0A8X6P5S6_NEPPI|nr:hypothetical protein NPIL_266501 [Nephila pilipes]
MPSSRRLAVTNRGTRRSTRTSRCYATEKVGETVKSAAVCCCFIDKSLLSMFTVADIRLFAFLLFSFFFWGEIEGKLSHSRDLNRTEKVAVRSVVSFERFIERLI